MGFLLTTTAANAAPASGSPSARLVYSRTPEASSCPAEPALRTAVAARFGYDPFFPWAKATIVVQISRLRAVYVARVQLLDEEGIALGTRELSSTQGDCSEIFDATALAISIALDAAAKKIAPEPPPEPLAPSPAPSTPPPAPVVPIAAMSPPSPPSIDAAGEPTPPPAIGRAEELHVEAGLDVLGSLGTGPLASPGVSAFARGRLQEWSLAIELRADAPTSVGRPADLGGGRVQSWVAGADLAPCLHLGILAVCAVGMIGALRASGSEIDPQFSKSTLFASAGGRVGLEWPLSGTVALRVRVDGAVNLYRVSLALGSEDVWTAPPFTGTLGGGLVVRFR